MAKPENDNNGKVELDNNNNEKVEQRSRPDSWANHNILYDTASNGFE